MKQTEPDTNLWQIRDVAHPSFFMLEEMMARGWDRMALASAMGGDIAENKLVIDMYFEVGPDEPAMTLGSSADDFARAFGISSDFLFRLERSWLAGRAALAERGGDGT